jgi:hypothetical protein
MNPIRNARRISRQAHLDLGGVYVQIERDGQKSDLVRVTVGYSKSFEEGDAGFFSYRTRAFLINVSDYTTDGSTLLEPQVGDIIHETINGTAKKFEVDHDSAEPEHIFPDAERRVYRINTKEVNS